MKRFRLLICLFVVFTLLFQLPVFARNQETKRIKITDAKISKIGDMVHTGMKLTPKPMIKDGGHRLKLNTDYTLSYKNNLNVGTASVIIKGKGKYYGTVTRKFQIKPKKVEQSENDERITINILIGNTNFTATLENNDTAKAFVNQLPLTINMSEHNGNEKFYYFSNDLRADSASNIGTINEGDLMLYSDNCLVLFYKTFDASYSYTKLGHIDKTNGLAQAVGSGDVEITFSIPE